MSSTYQNFLAIIGLAVLIFVGVLGVGMGNMGINKDGGMNGCIFTGKVMFCKMSIIQHISFWQRMFTAVPIKNIIPALLFFLAAFAIALLVSRKNLLNTSLSKHLLLQQRQRYQLNDISFNPVRYALAKGILHSKIYEPAFI